MDLIALLRTLTAVFGPSGQEEQALEQIQALLPGSAEAHADAMGNLIVHWGGAGQKLVFAAHMDTVGMMVTRVDKDGFCYFTGIGWLDPATIAHQTVVFENGVRGVVCIPDNKVGKEIKLSDLYLDIGAGDQAEAEKLVSVGDMAVFEPVFHEVGDRILSNYLDNRAGCAVLLSAMTQILAPKNDVYFLFSAQEEVGLRGAQPGAYGIDGAIGIAVDVTSTDDVPGSTHDGTTRLGKGAGIKVLDSAAMCRPAVIAAMEQAARNRDIPVQKDIMKNGGTDAGAMAGVRSGMAVGGISLPCRYTHAPVEVCDRRDLEACVRLVAALAETEIQLC